MIRTHIVEIIVDNLGKITETDLGWCKFAEVPIEKTAPQPGDAARQPLFVKINGARFGIIGHSWELSPKAVAEEPGSANFESSTAEAALADSVLVLFVQRISVTQAGGPGLVRAPAHALKEIELQVGVPGKRNGN